MKIFTVNDYHNKYIYIKDISNTIIYNNLYGLLMITKKNIDKHEKIWNKYRKYNNIYEYIGLLNSNIFPISRSYFKLEEIIVDFNLFNNNNIKVCCIAEGPGGFIQSLLNNYKKKKINLKKIYGITLISNNSDIPVWNIRILNNKIVDILYGKDNTGNICNIDNINDFIKTIGRNTCDLLTCDGGIDSSINFNNQEVLSYNLLYYEIYLSLNLQKDKGNLIIKMFDLLYHNSIQLLYLLYHVNDSTSKSRV